MNSVEKSIYTFGLYMILVVGLGLMIFPIFLLDLFRLPYGDDTWIRFVGLLAFVIGVFDLVMARHNLPPLYIWTVWLRLFATLFMIVFFATGKLGVGILAFAGIDLTAALWTWTAMRKTQ